MAVNPRTAIGDHRHFTK